MKDAVIAQLDNPADFWFKPGTEIDRSGKRRGKGKKIKKSIAQKKEDSISDYACKCNKNSFATRTKAHRKIIEQYHWHVRIFLCLVGSCHRSHIRAVIKNDEHAANVLIEKLVVEKEIRRIVIPNADKKSTEIFCWNGLEDTDVVRQLVVRQIINYVKNSNIDLKSGTNPLGKKLMDKLMNELHQTTSPEYLNKEYDSVQNAIIYWAEYYKKQLSKAMQTWLEDYLKSIEKP